MSILTGNEWQFETEFRPFNDVRDAESVQQLVLKSSITEEGINTREVDPFRQGVELRDIAHLGFSQPKLWTGNIRHFTRVQTVGQARSWVDFSGTTEWKELPRFDPAAFLQGVNFPTPIYLNEGPQGEEEAIIEPLTIPYRRDHLGPYFPRGVRGNLEDGNLQGLERKASRVSQMVDVEGDSFGPYLEEGESVFGGIRLEGFVSQEESSIVPFNDALPTQITNKILSYVIGDGDYIAVINTLNFNLDNDIRQTYGVRSSAAGNVIDASNTRYGTDSIAFIGTSRG